MTAPFPRASHRAAPALFRELRASRHVLESGLEVRIVEEPTVPMVTLVWCSPFGAVHDPPCREGLAVLSTHLLREGTARRSAQALHESLEALGADLFTHCDWDGSFVAIELLSEDLDIGLLTLCEVARTPSFADEALARRKRWQAAELAKRCRQAAALADDALAEALYGTARYGVPLLGREEAVRRLERSDVQDVHRIGAACRGSRLIAAGCVEAGAVLRRIERLVAPDHPAGSNAITTVELPAVCRPAGRHVILVEAPGAPRTELRLGWSGLPRTHDDFTRLTLLSAVLGGSLSSRLGRSLRERHGYVYGVRSRLDERRGPGPFVISAAAEHSEAGAVLRAILHEIDRLQQEPVPAAELQGAREHLTTELVMRLQTHHGMTRLLRQVAAYGRTEADVVREVEELAELDGQDLSDLARRHLDPGRLKIVAAGPVARLRPQLDCFGEAQGSDAPGKRHEGAASMGNEFSNGRR